MVLWFPSLGLFLLTSKAHRPLLWQRGFWRMTAVAAFCCLPIAIWNASHDWVTIRHVSGLAGGGSGTSAWKWYGPFVYLGTQCGLLLIFWFSAWVAAMVGHRPTVETDDRLCYLWWLSAPTFVVFLLFSPKTGGGEANWPAATYLSGLVLAAGWLTHQLQTPRSGYFRWVFGSLAAACLVGVMASTFLHWSGHFYPMLAAVTRSPSPENPYPLRQFDPTCRLRGWRTLAADVDRVCAELRAEGIEPVLAGTLWSLPGELGVYCQGHPTVYSIGLAVRDRRSQYDFWGPNPIWNPEQFLGRTFVIVGTWDADASVAFDDVGTHRVVTHHEGEQPVAAWGIRVCRGFRGFAPVSQLLQRQRF